MKRERENIMDDDDEEEDDDENPELSGPNRSNNFRISPESTTHGQQQQLPSIINNNNNNGTTTKSTTTTTSCHINNNKEQDRFLPIANVGRIMKKVIPGNGKISKDAKETVQECVSEFISFVTGEASDKCQREKRKTINGDDILWAIMTLGFEDYVNPLKLYLTKYREIEGEKLNLPKQQQQQRILQQPTHNNNDNNNNTSSSVVVYRSSPTNLMPHDPSNYNDPPPFPLMPGFSQNPMPSTTPVLPQQDHVDDHW